MLHIVTRKHRKYVYRVYHLTYSTHTYPQASGITMLWNSYFGRKVTKNKFLFKLFRIFFECYFTSLP